MLYCVTSAIPIQSFLFPFTSWNISASTILSSTPVCMFFTEFNHPFLSVWFWILTLLSCILTTFKGPLQEPNSSWTWWTCCRGGLMMLCWTLYHYNSAEIPISNSCRRTSGSVQLKLLLSLQLFYIASFFVLIRTCTCTTAFLYCSSLAIL